MELFIEPYLTRYVGSLAGFTVIKTLDQHQAGTPLVIASDHSLFAKNADAIQVVPRVNVLGVGCRKGVTDEMMQAALTEFCSQHQLLWRSIGKLASIQLKREEGALQYLATTLNAELEFYTAQQLQAASAHYPASPFVLKTVGVGNVACAAADFASGARTVTERYANHEITMAMSRLNEI